MSADWPRVKISDVCELIVDCVNKTAPRVEDETPYKMIRTPNIKNGRVDRAGCRFVEEETYKKWTRRAKVLRGDVLLTREAPMGQVGYVDFDDTVFLGQRIMQYRANPELLDSQYLLYAFLSSDLQHQFHMHEGSGSVVSHIRVPDCLKFELSLPPLGKQKRIAKVLGDIDKKIELNRQTNQTLENIAQSIFKSWFVDFEPTHAKIAAKQNGQDPERAAMAAISGKTITDLNNLPPEQQQSLKSTAALFPDTLTKSELGEIPEGWRQSEIGDEVTVAGGGTPSTKKEEFWERGHINWTSPKDMSNLTDKILLETNKKITKAGLAKISSGLLPKNTVLMSSRAPVGYLAISKIPVAINQGYIAMKCEGTLTPEYVVQWTESVMGDIKQRASGTTFAEISKKNFRIIPVIVPEVELLSEFSEITSDLYEKITEGLRETKSLIEIRDALLPKLLSGEMRLVG